MPREPKKPRRAKKATAPDAFEHSPHGRLMTRREMMLSFVRNRFVRTAIETSFMKAGALVAHTLLNRARFSKAELEELRDYDMTRRKGGKWLLASVVGAPMWEEIFFRAFPSKLLNQYMPGKTKETVWEAGIPISMIFAVAHIPNVPKKFQGKFMPISQFMMGCYYWYVMRQRGLLPAMASHSEANALIPVLEKVFRL
ncbi:MAG: CPBP family intramembrane metalloprotease [Candidatus Iainarchaeum archaeon]|uniref:CPBP family intramembrane metalloprotease n=1 Tax=Candidatus Iainarchaeum sp. TaxID=3101447 RepID=A0A7T9I220_9ARCH|nr:MAG: CPBP family intramembrane metalloprotease [Candidatus Diapherotrites archaeon]